MAESGVHTIAYAFRKVKIVTTAVDKEVNDNFHIIPGIGKLFFLLSLLMAESGVYTIAYAFRKVKIVTTAVDKEVNDNFHITPGIGKFAITVYKYKLSFQNGANRHIYRITGVLLLRSDEQPRFVKWENH